MAYRKKFSHWFHWQLASRFVLLLIISLVSVYFILTPGYPMTSTLFIGIFLILAFNIYTFLSKTNRDLTLFFQSIKHKDFSQVFNTNLSQEKTNQLNEEFNHIQNQLKYSYIQQELEYRKLNSILEHVPVPLLSLHENGKLELLNQSAKQIFLYQKKEHLQQNHPKNIEQLIQFSQDLYNYLKNPESSQTRLIRLEQNNSQRHMIIATTKLTLDGQKSYLISLQDIHSELEINQLKAWQELVKVLNHEIMNSISPINSLAKTSLEIVSNISINIRNQLSEPFKDLNKALNSVNSRSETLINFLEQYRQITHLPKPKIKNESFAILLDNIQSLFEEKLNEKGIQLKVSIENIHTNTNIDRSMVEQILINLISNAWQALEDDLKNTDKKIHLIAGTQYKQPCIKVIDNSSGIDENIKDKIFVPFFTTKKNGSGIGLALAKQIMMAHGGSIEYQRVAKNTCFILIF